MDANTKKQLMKRKSATLMLDDVVYTIVASSSKPSLANVAATDTSQTHESKTIDLERKAETDGSLMAAEKSADVYSDSKQDIETASVFLSADDAEKSNISTADVSHRTPTVLSTDNESQDVKQVAISRLHSVLDEYNTAFSDDARTNIGFAISVLESLRDSISDTNEEDVDREFPEVQQRQVPAEVREWLATTFTRQSALLKRRGNGQVKFRAVANVIRMGLMVEKMSRRVSTASLIDIPSPVVSALRVSIDLYSRMDRWDFDVFELADLSSGTPLRYLGYELFVRYGLIDKFKISPTKLDMFLQAIEKGYAKHKNPYHNALHACDVTQTAHHILTRMGLMQFLTHLELMSLLLSAIIHDVEHTGTTNNFHVNSGSSTALIYNDRSVLENHHVSTAFRILNSEECNFLSSLTRDEYTELRSLTIDMVLATDMSSHFLQIKSMKNYIVSSETVADKSKVLNLVLHCCDISHPSKSWPLHHRWTSLLLDEFFLQGDTERQLDLPISPLCDRTSTLIPQSQIGFIEYIVEPSMSVCGDILDRIYLYMHEGPDTVSQDNNQAGNYPWKPRPWNQCLQENMQLWKNKKQESEAEEVPSETPVPEDQAEKKEL